MSDRRLLDEVNILKSRLERYVAENEEDKILRILDKLANRNIAIDCLKETGIGKVVNKLRKHSGDVGTEAQHLIDHWKGTVETLHTPQQPPQHPPTQTPQHTPQHLPHPSTSREMREMGVSFVPSAAPCRPVSNKRKSPSPSPTTSSKRPPNETKNKTKNILAFSEDLLQDETLMNLLKEPYLPSTTFNTLNSQETNTNTSSNQLVRRNVTRTKMFAGRSKANTGVTHVPTLMELCIKVLTANVNNIEDMGPVPYHVIKPVLEACSPVQLRRIEGFNQHLIEDSDDLWRLHCTRDFKLAELEGDYDDDTFRDTYERKTEERAQKLRSLTDNIKRNTMAREAPVRQTKLAFVDTKLLTKGPRIPRSALEGAGPQPIGIKQRLKAMGVPAAPTRSRGGGGGGGSGGSGSATSGMNVSVSKASSSKSGPLMQKALKAFKNSSKR